MSKRHLFLGSLKPFDSKVDNFETWCENFGSLLAANGLDTGSGHSSPRIKSEADIDGPHSSDDNEETSSQEESDYESSESDEDSIVGDSGEESKQSSKRSPRPGFYGSGSTKSTFSLHRRKKLTATLKNMIGEAHVQFARGEIEMAVELCMEVIKEMPTSPEPYHTLAMIYENDPSKYPQYMFIAAFLQPRGFKDWAKIAQLSLDYGNKRQALMCYKKAIAGDPRDPKLRISYGELQEEMEDSRGALRTYSKFLADFPEEGVNCVIALRHSACLYHKSGEIMKAYECLTDALNSFHNHITASETNLMLELCIAMKRYVEACKVLIKFEYVKFSPELPEGCFETRESLSAVLQSGEHDCIAPDAFAVDLLAKLITILVHLEAYSISNKLSERMAEYEVDKYGDLYLDIAESYMAKRNYEWGLKFLVPLIRSEPYCQAAVWLRYAECLFLLVRLEEAVIAYQEVVKLAPNHSLAKLNLAVILQRLGRTDDALETLNQETDEEYLDPDLLMEKCQILCKKRQYVEFIEVAQTILSRHCLQIQDMDDVLVIVMASNFGKRHAAVLSDRSDRSDELLPLPPEPIAKFAEKELNLDRDYKLYLRLCRILFAMERWDLLSAAAYSSCASDLFSQVPSVESECEIHCYLAAVFTGDDIALPQHMRIVLSRHSTNTLILNLFSIALHFCDHARYTKHILRLLEKYPEDKRLMLLNAHISFATGTYKNACMEYTTLSAQTPDNPLVPLMMATTLLHIMTQKTSQGRVQLSINALAFMKKYLNLRGKCQESYYNMARVYHSMGLFGLAIYYYQLVLQTDPPADEKDPLKCEIFEDGNSFDLKCEAAFNLAQIYRASGARNLARSYLFKYVRI